MGERENELVLCSLRHDAHVVAMVGGLTISSSCTPRNARNGVTQKQNVKLAGLMNTSEVQVASPSHKQPLAVCVQRATTMCV